MLAGMEWEASVPRPRDVGGMEWEAALRAERRASDAKIPMAKRCSPAVWSEATKQKRPGSGVDRVFESVQMVDAIDQADCVVACLVTLSA
jgi:hypothetical protein